MIQPPHPVITEENLSLLWPQPQSILQQDGKPFVVGKQFRVYVSGGPAESKYQKMIIWYEWVKNNGCLMTSGLFFRYIMVRTSYFF